MTARKFKNEAKEANEVKWRWEVTFLLLAFGGFGVSSAVGGNSEQEVRTVLRQMIEADLKGDAATLDRTMTEDYTITRDNGVVRNKAETLQGIKDGTTKFGVFDTSDIQIRIYDNAALVTFRENIKGSRAGKDMNGQFREVRFFIKRGGSWRAVLAQRTRISS